MTQSLRYTVAGLPMQAFGGQVENHVALNARRAGQAVRTLLSTNDGIRIVVLPAYVLSGGFGEVAKDPHTELLDDLAACAREHKIHIAASDRFVCGHTAFVIGPDGNLLLTQTAVAEQGGDVSYAVASTPLGDMACLPKQDVTFPEYVRACLFQGAELILNPSVEIPDHRSRARYRSRAARCWENHCVLITAGLTAVIDEAGKPLPGEPVSGLAEVWEHTGALLATSTDAAAQATIDLTSLRRRRTEPWINFPAQMRSALYAEMYARAAASPGPPATGDDARDAPVYDVLLMQSHEVFATGPHDRDQVIADNMQRALGAARMFCGLPETRLVVFPEFFLAGSTPGDLDYWERMGIRVPGPETDKLARFAQETDVFLCAQLMEYDEEWPRRYFNTSVIISPQGEIILRYRKLQCADLNGLLNITTPGNIYSAYVEKYGFDGLIPVVETEIGVLGSAICFDSNWPELWRGMALKGVEVVCNPTSEIHSDRVPHWWSAKRAHAAENMYYVACANAGSEQFSPVAPVTHMNRGHSSLIDFNGRLATHADGAGVIPQMGRIDLGALRRARASKRENALARFRPEAVVRAYTDFPGFPLDCFLDKPMELASEGPALVRWQIERLTESGILKPPLDKAA